MRKTILVSTLSLLMLAGCGGGNSTSDNPTSEPQGSNNSTGDNPTSEPQDNNNATVELQQSQVSSIIKKTGQTKSYTRNGDEVTDSSIKDDAFYQKGLTPRYTRASDTVTDELTNLMWQDNETISKQWLNTSGDTAKAYCSNLSLSGYTDWRLPTSTELESIVDYHNYNPAISDEFKNTNSGNYWSSTSDMINNDYAWDVDFNSGYISNHLKDTNYYIRCVRNGQ